MKISSSSYNNNLLKSKPLLIGCSGGGGHISAINGIQGYLTKFYGVENISLIQYAPVLSDNKNNSVERKKIQHGAKLMHANIIGKPIRGVIDHTPLPILPSFTELEVEVSRLSSDEARKKSRTYIDMLLDVYPAGYESAAIWNVLQRNDKTSELRKLIDLQEKSDKDNYQVVYDYYTDLLTKAKPPFTEIISTQAMALPALCDAVKDYNQMILDTLSASPPVLIHQYMTDLPTKGAVHFFNSLSTLTKAQQQQMRLYAVGITENIVNHFFPQGTSFNGIYDIPPNLNPMVRPGFNDAAYDNSQKYDKTFDLVMGKDTYQIKANEQIASIMLGSQAGNDTVEYIETLLKNGMDKIFVFGASNKSIQEKIAKIQQDNPLDAHKIIGLPNQDDKGIAPLMTRSNVVVIRGGGLSVMEQMAMPHNKEQTVLIHHANSKDIHLSSGISWEDDNVAKLIDFLKDKGVHAEKTSPDRAMRHLAEAQLLVAIKKIGIDFDANKLAAYVKTIPTPRLEKWCQQIKTDHNVAFLDIIKTAVQYSDKEPRSSVINQLKIACDQCLASLKIEIEHHADYKPSQADKTYKRSADYIELIMDYKKVEILRNTALSAEQKPMEKLASFKQQYSKLILSPNTSTMERFINEVRYQLSKLSFFKSLATPLTPLRQTIDRVLSGDDKSIALKI